jgi:hypothetical protein
VERNPVEPDRRRAGERRALAFGATAAGAVVATSLILLLVTLTGGNGNGAERIDFSDFEGGLLGLGENDYRQFFATCAPGRLTVEFRPDDEVRITRDEGELIAALNTKEASVGCAGALEDARGRGFYVRGLRRVVRPTALECLAQKPVQLVVHPIFRHETDVYGGSVVLGIPVPNLHPRALVISAFTEDGRSDIWYRPGSCRISQR